MEFKTMADVEAWRQRERIAIRLRWQANNLCNVLYGMLDWRRDPADLARIERVLARARARLARREALR